MASKEQQEIARWILEYVGTVNPYNRRLDNRKSEYYIYQGGFLAGYLASLFEEDPHMFRQFKKHIQSKRG